MKSQDSTPPDESLSTHRALTAIVMTPMLPSGVIRGARDKAARGHGRC
jgi:hypothetical protein